MHENVAKVKKVIAEAIPKIPKERRCECESALRGALL
jgi:hypothetical protein